MQRWLLWTVGALAVATFVAGCGVNPTPGPGAKRRSAKPARTADAPDETAPADPDAAPTRWRITTVCIDAGHGGEDSGTETDGAVEKVISLDIALRVRAALEHEGLSVVMTRDTDRAVARRERAAIANRAGAGLFLSIHCNGYDDPDVAGIEVYHLGRGASAEATQFAAAVHDALIKALDERDRGVRPAGFTVLAETRCPAVLVEVGYLSNDGDRARLTDEQDRQTIAAALAGAIVTFASNDGTDRGTASAPSPEEQ